MDYIPHHILLKSKRNVDWRLLRGSLLPVTIGTVSLAVVKVITRQSERHIFKIL